MNSSQRAHSVAPARTALDIQSHLAEAEKVWRSRPDLQAAYPDPKSAEYWLWVQWFGAAEYGGLETGSFVAPPGELIARVVGEVTPLDFHRSGLVDWRRMRGALDSAGFRFEGDGGGGDLLEFGCGCGRILRFFGRYLRTCRLQGVDVDEGAIDWCRKNLAFAAFEVIPKTPSLPFPDASFDAIYAFSVFSHLPEALHLGWLRELKRVARPGGPIVLTTQGRRVLGLAKDGTRPEVMPNVTDPAAAAARAEAEGFFFTPYGSLRNMAARSERHFEKWDLEAYGSTFILEPYVRRKWGELFDVVDFVEAPDGWQDYVTLRAR